MAEFLKDKSIKYLTPDFDGFKRDLMRYTEAHHSGVFQTYNESSPGMALLEHAAYVGDVLAYYINMSFNELKMTEARQAKNVDSFAKSLGYRPKGPRAARGKVHIIIEVPSVVNSRGEVVPDDQYSPVLLKGARVEGKNGSSYETLENIYFSASIGRDVTGSQFDPTSGYPTYFALRKSVDVVAGKTKTQSFEINSFEQFKTIELSDTDVIEIISVEDSEGNDWVEVDYLAQDTVFDSDVNSGDDGDDVPYVLKLRTVPRRFVKDRDPVSGKTSLTFGSGDGLSFDDQLVPNLADLALPLAGRATFSSYPLDPQNFLKTRSLGLSPYDTTITVTFRVGGGQFTNVPKGVISSVSEADFDFLVTGLDSQKIAAVERSVECINMDSITGGAPAETIEEIKLNAGAYFAAQDRCVTREDYITRVLSLPEKFGKPDKVFVKKNSSGIYTLDVHTLARDSDNHLCLATTTLKKNIKTYLSRYRTLTDGINVLDASILNLKLSFGIVVSPKFNRSEVLLKCLSVLYDYFNIDRWQIGQPIVLSEIMSTLQEILGVVSVYELKFTSAAGVFNGLAYSSTSFNIAANTSNNIIYCPTKSIFEIKYPKKDIVGVAK